MKLHVFLLTAVLIVTTTGSKSLAQEGDIPEFTQQDQENLDALKQRVERLKNSSSHISTISEYDRAVIKAQRLYFQSRDASLIESYIRPVFEDVAGTRIRSFLARHLVIDDATWPLLKDYYVNGADELFMHFLLPRIRDKLASDPDIQRATVTALENPDFGTPLKMLIEALLRENDAEWSDEIVERYEDLEPDPNHPLADKFTLYHLQDGESTVKPGSVSSKWKSAPEEESTASPSPEHNGPTALKTVGIGAGVILAIILMVHFLNRHDSTPRR